MKKIITLITVFMTFVSLMNAQEYNLFDADDIDENGWLWFDTQAKIDKYVGVADEDNYSVNPDGKIIQMLYANIMPDYPETFASPDSMGIGTDESNSVGGENAKKGAIILAPASAMMSTNGGCLILNLPSCNSISLFLSSEARMLGRNLMITPGKDLSIDDSAAGADTWTGSTKVIYSKATVFGSISSAGQFLWEGIASLNNGNNPDYSFVSNDNVYYAFQNCNKYPIYVHGIKITIPKMESSSIKVLNDTNNDNEYELYGIDGRFIGKYNKNNQLPTGIYLIKQNNIVKKLAIK